MRRFFFLLVFLFAFSLFPLCARASSVSLQIDLQSARNRGLTGKNTLVAVIDTGLSPYNPAYAHRIVGAYQIVKDQSIKPYSPDPAAIDKSYHGTQQTGIIAGQYLSQYGIAYEAKLLLIETQMDTETLACAICFAVDQGVQVINMSLCADRSDAKLLEAIQYAENHNVLVVASVGNTGDTTINYPAAYPTVLAVASVNAQGKHSTFSVQGKMIALSAPGEDLATFHYDGSITTCSGTSGACSLVSGVCALLKQAYPQHSAQQIRHALMQGAAQAELVHSDTLGYGCIHIGKTLKILDAALPKTAHTTAETAKLLSPYSTTFEEGRLDYVGDTVFYRLVAPEKGLYRILVRVPFCKSAQIALAQQSVQEMMTHILENDVLAPSQSRELSVELEKGENILVLLRYAQPCTYQIRVDGLEENEDTRLIHAFSDVHIAGLLSFLPGANVQCGAQIIEDTLVLSSQVMQPGYRLTIPQELIKLILKQTHIKGIQICLPLGNFYLKCADLSPNQALEIKIYQSIPFKAASFRAWYDKDLAHTCYAHAKVQQGERSIPICLLENYWFEDESGNFGVASPEKVQVSPFYYWK